jgi:hypothetical protein
MRLTFTLSLLLLVGFTKAQYHDQLMFGLKAGADFSTITNLTNTLVNDEYKPLYYFSEKGGYQPAVSLFTHYRFDQSQIGIDARISYYQAATEIEKRSQVTATIEDYDIRYHYLSIGLYSKVYLYRGFNLGIGANVGACLNSSSGIAYQSSTATVAQNMQSQEQIRQVLKGRTNITAGAVMGYEFKFGLSVEAAYHYGLTDMIETIVNPYKFAESRNNSRSLQLTIGWAISREGFYF